MPRLANRLPRLRRHRSSGQAVVTIDGKDLYLGKFGTAAARRAYHALMVELQVTGQIASPAPELTVVELVAKYWTAVASYHKNPHRIRSALRPLSELYAELTLEEFGPKKLKVVQARMIAKGWSRPYINACVGIIKRMFRWGVSEELVAPDIWQALDAVEGLRKGRTDAPEGRKIKPVSDDIVAKTLQQLGPVVADMVRVQRLIGGRPQDIYNMRPCDLDRSGDVWTYQPESHKGELLDLERVLFVGPRAQSILQAYLNRDPQDYCFSPREAEERRLAARHAARTTPMSCGNKPGTNKKRKRKRPPADQYDKNSYGQAIRRAALKAGVEVWSPNRLRHTMGTEIRRDYGLEAAQVFLGHARADITQVYAERNAKLGIQVAKEIG